MKFIKSIKPELALASLFAVLSLTAIIAGQYGRNGYFTIAAAAFALATYAIGGARLPRTYPSSPETGRLATRVTTAPDRTGRAR